MHQQHQQPHHHVQQHNAGLPPPMGGNTGFGLGNANNAASPFSIAGSNSSGGFERGLDGGAGLGSHAAQMSFARGGPVQHNNARTMDGIPLKDNRGRERIREVWKHNLFQEMDALRQLIDDYPYIAMDTEFPGIVARPIGNFANKPDYHYQTLRCNVDLLKMIQLGITLFATDGSLPPATPTSSANAQTKYMAASHIQAPCTWQFNFKFSLSSDMYAEESTSMLRKAGIDFALHEKNGIDPHEFGALLIPSGLVHNDDVHWISFHSGYDFGYLMKIMLCMPLPDTEDEFHDLLTKYFPSLFDIKFMFKHADRHRVINNNNQPVSSEASNILTKLAQTKGGLQDAADELGINRMGIAHQAGSDSWVTGQVYFKMREKIFGGTIESEKYSEQVWGLSSNIGSSTRSDLTLPNMNGAVFYSQNGTPSTPQTSNVGLASQARTPVPASNLGLGGQSTPGGAFGQFTYDARV